MADSSGRGSRSVPRPLPGAAVTPRRYDVMASGGVVEGPGRLIVQADGSAPHWDSPEYAARIAAAREDLTTSSSTHLVLRRMAKAGDATAAWILVGMLADTLGREGGTPAAAVASEFFGQLEQLRERAKRAGKPLGKTSLTQALVTLGIAKSRGRPARQVTIALGEPSSKRGWELVQQLAIELSGNSPLLRWGAGFFRRLLQLQADGTTADLSLAFRRLCIVRGRGRPLRNDDTYPAALLALEELQRRASGNCELARAALESGQYRVQALHLRDIRTNNKDLARIVSPNRTRGVWIEELSLLEVEELTALAGYLQSHK